MNSLLPKNSDCVGAPEIDFKFEVCDMAARKTFSETHHQLKPRIAPLSAVPVEPLAPARLSVRFGTICANVGTPKPV